ncbi:hypothetical protein PIB30_012780 [Stylosanthes scabra]|uniref:Uncharacterized protein n=1 Tax=Stylosanthes scabra TaxID=79078 RepID=A0ABU6T5X6_9FABA|nr:hypothetical protein [Stylosanthes scabra]
MRVRIVVAPTSSAATSSMAISKWASVAVLAVTEFLDFTLEVSDQNKEVFNRSGVLFVSHSCKKEQIKEKTWDKSLRLGSTVGANVLGWVVGKEGLFEGKSTARASKRTDSGDKSLERRGVDLQGHSDAQVNKVYEREKE